MYKYVTKIMILEPLGFIPQNCAYYTYTYRRCFDSFPGFISHLTRKDKIVPNLKIDL